MNYIDIILCVPLLWGFYKGFSKGLIIEITSIIALGLSIWGGVKFSGFLIGFMCNSLKWDSKYLPVISFAIIFLGILILCYAIAKLTEKFVNKLSLGFVNKLLGGIFGMLKFGLILSVLIFILNAIEKNVQLITPEIKQKSLLYEPVGKIAPIIIPVLRENKFVFT